MATATADRLEQFGVGFGLLLVLVGAATLLGVPGALSAGGPVLLIGKLLGALAAIAVGVGLAWLVRR